MPINKTPNDVGRCAITVWVALSLALVNSSAQSLDQLRGLVKEHPNAYNVSMLGSKGNATDIPLLRSIAPRLPKSAYSDLQKALAQLGDLQAFLQIAGDCYDKSGERQGRGFDSLDHLLGPLSFRVLVDRLGDFDPAPREWDELFSPPSGQSLMVLSRIVPDPPIRITGRELTFSQAKGAAAIWQKYFRSHPDILKYPPNLDWPAALRKLIEIRDDRAILVLGRLADPSLLPDLRAARSSGHLKTPVSNALRAASAHLGDPVALAEIQTRTQSRRASVRGEAIDEVIFVGGKPGVEILSGLLTTASRHKHTPSPASELAAGGLAHIIEGFPRHGTLEQQQGAVREWVSRQE